MGEPKIGDKLFLYGQFLLSLNSLEDYEYNSVLGYRTSGGYYVHLIETGESLDSVPGFVVDFSFDSCLTPQTPFDTKKTEMIDVSGKMSLQSPSLSGSKVWAPNPTTLASTHSFSY